MVDRADGLRRCGAAACVAGIGAGVIAGGQLLLGLVEFAFGHDPTVLFGPVAAVIGGSDTTMTRPQALGWWLAAVALYFLAAMLLGALFRRRRPVPAIVVGLVPLAGYLDVLVVAEFIVERAMSPSGFDPGGTPWWGFALGLPVMWPWAALVGLAGPPVLVAAPVTAMLAWRRLWRPAVPRRIPDELIEDAARDQW